jgi:hypothetical protein
MLTVFAWIFFRAENLTHAFDYVRGIFLNSNLEHLFSYKEIVLLFLIAQLLTLDWIGRNNKHALQKLSNKKFFNFIFYLILIVEIILFKGQSETFIYFQF